MQKLILKCGLAPGDLVMLSAAVRDLHRWYPGRFLTDVRTACPELWEHNPYLTPISDHDPQAESIDCSYPLINRCNEAPYHCLHGFIDFLNERLGLAIKPTAFKGDIHLSAREKAWFSQVHELTGQDTPFWLIAAGGKYDITIKWWQTERYQQVVDHFHGQIQFVQVGSYGHHHPRLEGVIDLRGKTNLRQLIRLVYHAQGVLCSVTALMHLAAAVETRPSRSRNRPCVVVAGGREPAHWEAYPDHQFIHTNGALACCAAGGCWRDRTRRLRDGDPRDRPNQLCLDMRNGLPRCMDLITPAEVIRRIKLYFEGGVLRFLTPRQRITAETGVRAAAKNPYDKQRLSLQNAGLACEQFIRAIPPSPACSRDRGIVICASDPEALASAAACVRALRRLGCRLPVQLWHLGRKNQEKRTQSLLAALGTECIDALRMRRRFPVRILQPDQLQAYALLRSPFRQILLLDPTRLPVADPELLFQTPQFQSSGALFSPDYACRKTKTATAIWRSCGLRQPREPGLKLAPLALVDKQRCWRALCLALWFQEHADFYSQHLPGASGTFHLAFRKLNQKFSLLRKPTRWLRPATPQPSSPKLRPP